METSKILKCSIFKILVVNARSDYSVPINGNLTSFLTLKIFFYIRPYWLHTVTSEGSVASSVPQAGVIFRNP